jgi:hypothetical protein
VCHYFINYLPNANLVALVVAVRDVVQAVDALPWVSNVVTNTLTLIQNTLQHTHARSNAQQPRKQQQQQHFCDLLTSASL